MSSTDNVALFAHPAKAGSLVTPMTTPPPMWVCG